MLILQERRKRMYQGRGASVLARNKSVADTMTNEMLEIFNLDALAARVAQALENRKKGKKN